MNGLDPLSAFSSNKNVTVIKKEHSRNAEAMAKLAKVENMLEILWNKEDDPDVGEALNELKEAMNLLKY